MKDGYLDYDEIDYNIKLTPPTTVLEALDLFALCIQWCYHSLNELGYSHEEAVEECAAYQKALAILRDKVGLLG